MDRREWMKRAAAAAVAAGVSGRLLAVPAARARFLLVFMRGGYDCANLLVPTGSDFYYAARPNIAIPRPDSGPDAALSLDAYWGLHPALRETVFPLYAKGEAAFIAFAGTDDLTRSHFETQDSLELGQPLAGRRDFQSGFLARFIDVLGGASAISFTAQLPIAFRGKRQIPNLSLKSLGRPSIDARQAGIIAAMYDGTPLGASVHEGFAVRDEVTRAMDAEMEAASRNAISSKGFELEARRIATLMKEQFNIGFVDVGGWDTHVGEGGARGYLANRLDEFGRGLAAFADEMGSAWRDTIVVAVSEFGRTFRENGNRGTDHGHGSVYWVLGGGIRGRRIAGDQVELTEGTLFQQRDYPVLSDCRAVLGGLFRRAFGLGTAQLERVFPGAVAKDLGLV